MWFIKFLVRLIILLSLSTLLLSASVYIFHEDIDLALKNNLNSALKDSGYQLETLHGFNIWPPYIGLSELLISSNELDISMHSLKVSVLSKDFLIAIWKSLRSQTIEPASIPLVSRAASMSLVATDHSWALKAKALQVETVNSKVTVQTSLEHEQLQVGNIIAEFDLDTHQLEAEISELQLAKQELVENLYIPKMKLALSPIFSPGVASLQAPSITLILAKPKKKTYRLALSSEMKRDSTTIVNGTTEISSEQNEFQVLSQWSYDQTKEILDYVITSEDLKYISELTKEVFATSSASKLSSGSIQLKGALDLKSPLPHEIKCTTSARGIEVSPLNLSTLHGNSKILIDDAGFLAQGDMQFEGLFQTIDIDNGRLQFKRNFDGHSQIAAELEALNGKLSISTLRLSPSFSPVGNALFRAEGISLARILEFYPSDIVQGTGNIILNIPMQFNPDGVKVSAGTLRASPAEGTLKYIGPQQSGTPSELGFLLDILRDYHYTSLEADVDLHEDGTLILGTRLSGFNPQVNKGQSVNVNLKLEENLPKLIQSIKLLRTPDKVLKKKEQKAS